MFYFEKWPDSLCPWRMSRHLFQSRDTLPLKAGPWKYCLTLNRSVAQRGLGTTDVHEWMYLKIKQIKSQIWKHLLTKHWLYMIHICNSASRCQSLITWLHRKIVRMLNPFSIAPVRDTSLKILYPKYNGYLHNPGLFWKVTRLGVCIPRVRITPNITEIKLHWKYFLFLTGYR